MNTLSNRLKTELIEAGASMVGFADLGELPAHQRNGFGYGISIAVAIGPAILNGIGNGPTREYEDEYHRINKLLDCLDLKAAEILREQGYEVLPKTRPNVRIDYRDRSTLLPHKTVATRAGLGWIGKCAMLVTEPFGSAVRISSVLTDAPLEVDVPINESRCGACGNCVRNCPAEALSGDLWSAGKEREAFYDYSACRRTTIERSWRITPAETLCGLCVLVCPWTRKYIKSIGMEYGFPSADIASKGDLEDILELQKLAYQSEAEIYGAASVPPLVQTLAELQQEAKGSILLKVVEDRRIIGSVRAFEKDGICYIGKLIVHPDYQNKGIGKKLMKAVEECFDGAKYQLFTGHMSRKNIHLYEKLGYKRIKTEDMNEAVQLVYMEK